MLNALPVLLAVGMKSAAASQKHHHLHLTLRPTSSERAKLAFCSRSGESGEEINDTHQHSGPSSSLSFPSGVCEVKG